MKKLGILLATSAMLALVVPVVTADLADMGAAYAKSDKGGGGGGGKDKSSKDKSSKDKSSKGSSSKSSSSKPAKPAKAKPTKASAPVKAPKAAPNIHAELGGMNSLKRNINGIMNSSDPKMASVRSFIIASAAYEAALGDEAAAQEAYASYAESLMLSEDPEAALEEIAQLRSELLEPVAPEEPAEGATEEELQSYIEAMGKYAEDLEAYNSTVTELDEAEAAATALSEAQTAVAATEEAASEDALEQAIIDGMNATGKGGMELGDLSDEALEWAKKELGYGEADGAIDDYIAMQEEDVDPLLEPETTEEVAVEGDVVLEEEPVEDET